MVAASTHICHESFRSHTTTSADSSGAQGLLHAMKSEAAKCTDRELRDGASQNQQNEPPILDAMSKSQEKLHSRADDTPQSLGKESQGDGTRKVNAPDYIETESSDVDSLFGPDLVADPHFSSNAEAEAPRRALEVVSGAGGALMCTTPSRSSLLADLPAEIFTNHIMKHVSSTFVDPNRTP